MIALMVGGRASRMGRGVKSIDKTKGLLELPGPEGTETIIDRTLRLLKKIGAIESESDVLMCVGYKAEMVMERYPESHFLKTYDPENPTDILPGYLQVINEFPVEHYTFTLGDVVWSEKALSHFMGEREKAPLVMYHGKETGYTEIFGMGVNGEAGKDLIRRAMACDSVPVVPGEIRWALKKIKRIKPKDARTSCFEQWVDLKKLPGKLRVYQQGAVDDIDWDNQHKAICSDIMKGIYG